MPSNRKATITTSSNGAFTLPGLTFDAGSEVAEILQERLVALIDLGLTLKHVHWNVVGPHFIGVHEMLDPQVAGVLEMVDVTAERIAALGTSPNGLSGHLVAARSWDDYELERASVAEHLGALEVVYRGVIASHRDALALLDDLDRVTQDLLSGQTAVLEQFHWLIRAHLESASGQLATAAKNHEREAADRARKAG